MFTYTVSTFHQTLTQVLEDEDKSPTIQLPRCTEAHVDKLLHSHVSDPRREPLYLTDISQPTVSHIWMFGQGNTHLSHSSWRKLALRTDNASHSPSCLQNAYIAAFQFKMMLLFWIQITFPFLLATPRCHYFLSVICEWECKQNSKSSLVSLILWSFNLY